MSIQRIYINHNEFQPTEGLVLVRPIELKKEEVSSGGIITEIRKESVIERPTYGEVLAVGKDCLNANIGQIVFWDMQSGLDLQFEDEKLMLIFFPVPIKAKYFIPIMVLIEFYMGYKNIGNVAHFAHLGGGLIGFLLARSWKKNLYRWN